MILYKLTKYEFQPAKQYPTAQVFVVRSSSLIFGAIRICLEFEILLMKEV